MPDPGDSLHYSSHSSFPGAVIAGGDFSSGSNLKAAPGDPIQPLMNLSAVNSRMDSLHSFLSDSIARNVPLGSGQMEMVSSEISSAIQQVIVNGAALLAFAQIPNPSSQSPNVQISVPPKIFEPNPAGNDSIIEERKVKPLDEQLDESEGKIDLDLDLEHEHEVIELDAVEILAEHVHFCEICGKGFKRDANLRMHMRAHGDQFKRPEALAKPPAAEGSSNLAGLIGGKKAARFSCPFAGCNRNQHHRKFKPLKSVICVRNHFKRSHCPKMYSCNRCHKKNFSVLSDLKSHLKNCGESKWRCSCGTTFSRKDKLFGHMALFEGHMPAIGLDDDDKGSKSNVAAFMEDDEVVASVAGQGTKPEAISAAGGGGFGVADDEFFDDGLFDDFATIDEKCIQEMFGSSASPDFVQQFYNI